MVLPDALPAVFPDLARADLASASVVFHQRFSTNTAPAWKLAQPFRLLAHNGEINTIEGNRHWSLARGKRWSTPRIDFAELQPLVSLTGSDSQSLDNMLEALLVGGMDLLQAMRILIPPATSSLEYKDPDLAAFYEYYGLSLDPWDGPAGIVLCDGRYAACTLDRNGLRPARWMLTDQRQLIVASETGVFDCAPENIVAKGKLGPGEMLAIDLQEGKLLHSEDIDAINRARAPFKRWLKQGVTYLTADLIDPSLAAEPFDSATLRRFQKLFQLTREERESVLRVLAETEQEATGSMGDDTPFAVLSHHVRPLYDYFRQAFAQVTNPPIDPLREQVVMSLTTQIGREGNVFEMKPENARQVMLNSPVLSQRKLRQLLLLPEFVEAHVRLDLYLLHGEIAAGRPAAPVSRSRIRGARRLHPAAAVGPLSRARLPADPCPAGHRRDPSPPGPRRAALRLQPDHRDRHRARPAPVGLPDRLRRDRDLSLPRLPDAGRARPQRRAGGQARQ